MKNKFTISIIGSGYVGLVNGACLSNFGFNIIFVTKEREKAVLLSKGKIPIFEPNLEKLLRENISIGRIIFTDDINYAIQNSKVIFIAVDTPLDKKNCVNLHSIISVAKDIASYLNEYKVIALKSTTPVGTANRIKQIILKNKKDKSISFDIVSNPEFFKQGSAIYDFNHPNRIVLGVENKKSLEIMKIVYESFIKKNIPLVVTNLETAEIIKYACNIFLATKISFINEIANICEIVGTDVSEIARVMGLDNRISPLFLNPGAGYGGLCFSNDTKAFYNFISKKNYEFKILKSVIEVNERQKYIMINKIKKHIGEGKNKVIAFLGLSFKENTDDIRKSIPIEIINLLAKEEIKIKCYDPKVTKNTKEILGKVTYCNNLYEAISNCNVLVIGSKWNEFRNIKLDKVKKLLKCPVIIDLYNLYNPKLMKEKGFIYEGVGRYN